MGLRQFLIAFGHTINTMIKLSLGIALLVFFWGLAQFLLKKGDEKAVAEGRNRMVWGVVALFVMVSVWGIVGYVRWNLGLAQAPAQPLDTASVCDGSPEDPCL